MPLERYLERGTLFYAAEEASPIFRAAIEGKNILAVAESVELVRKYLSEVSVQWRTGIATEHSYRPALKTLLEGLLQKVIVINEPQHIKCGAPDYILRDRRTALHLGFIEAKDIGDGDLDGNGVHKEQFNRYKNSLESLCFTDYLDFHFYENGVFKDKVRIAEICGDKLVPADEHVIELFVGMIEHFGSAKVQKISSPVRLAKLMAGKARLLAQAIKEYLLQDVGKESMLAQQMLAFRDVLIHDISEETFADVYAQTITYGMFAARLHDDTPENFSRAEAASLIPKTNPLLRQMFNYIAADTNDTVEWIVDDLITLFAASDLVAIMKDYGKATEQTDPILHFYEDFLAAYNPELRKARGVWYTPQPVVSFIVRSVDRILETEFGLQGGLANNSKAKFKVVNDNKAKKSDKQFIEREMHRVQILDPATGTGTFLAETVRQIHAKFTGMQGMWQNYVSEHLLPRLNGFEILMASYAMAHLKLDMLLAETGYKHESNERLRVFLTNSLEEHDKEVGTLFAAALSKEANEANFLKRDCPVMVVLGNPPYSGVSNNNGDWITELVDCYKKEPNSDLPLQERKHWLNDDYVKFIRMAQHCIDKNDEGILAFINNNGFLDNPTFRGMRWSLLSSFDKIYVVNLHGNSMKKELSPDGGVDENVFDIMVGTSINIFVKKGKKFTSQCAKVLYADVFGSREHKYAELSKLGLNNVEFSEVNPCAPYYFFVPRSENGRQEYESGFSLNKLSVVNSTGVLTMGDCFAVDFAFDEEARKVRSFLENEYTEETLKGLYSLGKNYASFILQTKPSCEYDAVNIRPYSYRPFDTRFVYFDSKVIWRHRINVMRHLSEANLALTVCRQGATENWTLTFVTDKLADDCYVSNRTKERGYVFPLYLYNDTLGKVEKTPNLDREIWEKINAAAGFDTAPEDVFHYIYAVLHTPEYRERHKEFLKVDFPRIPYPKNGETFRKLADIGERLVKVHLLKDEVTRNMFDPHAQFPASGTNRVEAVKYVAGRVQINGEQYFDNVPEAAWNFFIGGYQPAQKWLKDRKGRALSADDILHYKSIVIALLETSRMMSELSLLSSEWMAYDETPAIQ